MTISSRGVKLTGLILLGLLVVVGLVTPLPITVTALDGTVHSNDWGDDFCPKTIALGMVGSVAWGFSRLRMRRSQPVKTPA